MALLVPPAFTGSSHPTRMGAKMVLNDEAEHRCSAPGLGAELDDASRFPHFPKIVLRISDKNHIWLFFFHHLPPVCRNEEVDKPSDRCIRILLPSNSSTQNGTVLTNARQDLQVTTGPGKHHIYKYTRKCLTVEGRGEEGQ